MSDKNKSEVFTQAQGAKKAKRIASIIYLLILAFLVGGSWLHQQKLATQTAEEEVEVIEFKEF